MSKIMVVAGACALALAGCSNPGHDQPTPARGTQTATDEAPPASATSSPPADASPSPAMPPLSAPPSPQPSAPPRAPAPAPAPPPAPTQEAQKGEKGARAVLLTWARALENRQFRLAWKQFGSEPPSTRQEFAKWWSRYRTITVAVPTGTMEGAAGSSYYTAHATLTGITAQGKPFRLEGPVVLRRVNDVPGATPDQLRWHIESARLNDTGA